MDRTGDKMQESSSDENMARSARQMASVMPVAREWQDLLWDAVLNRKTAHVSLRVTIHDGQVQQVQKVCDAIHRMQ